MTGGRRKIGALSGEKLMGIGAMGLAKWLFVFAALCAASAWSQGYPSKPIKIIVPFPPGGTTDVVGRVVAQHLSENLGQQVVLENRGGAGGTVGAEAAARAAPDGYTLFYASTSTLSISPNLYRRLPYDPRTSFAPISLVASAPMFVTINSKVAAMTLRQFIELAKQRPGEFHYSSSGNGTPVHIGTELFKSLAGVNLVHVPYRGGGPALQAVMAGDVQVMVNSLAVVLPQIQSGRLRALAVTSTARDPELPEVPTTAEAGVPGFLFSLWNGLVAPAGTPPEIIARLNSALLKAIASPSMVQVLSRQGLQATGNTPEQFGAFIASELSLWEKLIRESGAKVDD